MIFAKSGAPRDVVPRLALYAFVLNFAWEMLQGRYFVGMLEIPWWAATRLCLRASVGDIAMIVLAYGAVVIVTRDHGWLFGKSARAYAVFMLLSALQALALEWYSVRLGRWSYVPGMPVDPMLGVGLAPFLQWLILPLLAGWMVRRASR